MNSCYKTTDNKYNSCPPRMDDARHFTDYRPNCTINNIIKLKNNNINSHDYRQFLIANASKIMELNRKSICDLNCCGPCDFKEPAFQQSVKCNKNNCERKEVDAKGIGLEVVHNDVPKKWPAQVTKKLIKVSVNNLNIYLKKK